ncbi:MAG: gluconate 2-dehydrogenase subunit 3 family protein [Chitinophagaceae bacterium]|nr:MAG: gluconate 2-dehydrogenase subunit 3 family protein [Chitinophagaceae bacterium]
MDRRQSLRLIATGAIATGAVAAGCNTTEDKKAVVPADPKLNIDRYGEELAYEKSLIAKGHFFNEHELKTITVLADIIIPKDEVSGSASDAQVPHFIDFIVWDMPQHQLPMQGGLKWLDMYCFRTYDKPFVNLDSKQQIEVVDQIAYPDKAKPDMRQGVKFFSLMRNLTATGFYSAEIGLKDVGYAGNQPNNWKGVPDDVLKQYNIAYTQKELDECVTFKENV